MSYIRCLNNPEGLYIWHDVGGYIAISHNGSTELKRLPVKLFYDLCKDFASNGDTPVEKTSGPDRLHLDETSDFSRYTLSYQGDRVEWDLPMWQVTWWYIVRNVMRTLAWEKKHAKKRRNKTCKPSLKRK